MIVQKNICHYSIPDSKTNNASISKHNNFED